MLEKNQAPAPSLPPSVCPQQAIVGADSEGQLVNRHFALGMARSSYPEGSSTSTELANGKARTSALMSQLLDASHAILLNDGHWPVVRGSA